jgi:hypothetical protein
VKAGFLELPRVTDITGYEIGNTAASIGNEVILIHHDYSGIWLQPLEATSSFRSKRDSTDNDNVFWHVYFLLASFVNTHLFIDSSSFYFNG